MSHAIIMGGSIAGLCAAAALARNFDRVTVLERDAEPGPNPRRSVPQGNHSHCLLRRGQEVMDDLFPGAFDALAAADSTRVDTGTGFRWFQFGCWKRAEHIDVEMWLQSRPLLEHCLRESLKSFGNVELRFSCTIDAPVHERGRVVGVRLRDGEYLQGDVVVDAMGRGSRSPTWLAEWGCGRVAEQRVEIGMGYVSGVFELAGGERMDHAVAVYQMPPDNRRLGLAFPIEGGRVMVTLAGYHGEHAPTDEAGFRAWARGLMSPEIANLLDHAELVGSLSRFGCREQVRRIYGRFQRLPDGYLVLGDSLCNFDPTFGQGMSVAALQAERLKALRPGMSTRRLQWALTRITSLPFSMTTNEAHRWTQTRGWQPPMGRLQRWYLAQVFAASAHDALVYRKLVHVMHFLASPLSIFGLPVIKRLIVNYFEGRRVSKLPPARSGSVEVPLPALHQTGF